LAQHRRARGLAATSISWGALADVGMLARNERALQHLARAGIRPMSVAAATAALERVLEWDPVCIALLDGGGEQWRQLYPDAGRRPRFSRVLDAGEDPGGNLPGRDIRTALRALTPEERVTKLAAAIADVLAVALRIPVAKVDPLQPLAEMGIDSLTGTELQTALGLKLGVNVSILELLRGSSIRGLAETLLKKMNLWQEPPRLGWGDLARPFERSRSPSCWCSGAGAAPRRKRRVERLASSTARRSRFRRGCTRSPSVRWRACSAWSTR